MIFTDLLIWWYGPGWQAELHKIFTRATRVFDAFSVTLLARTLFAPFKQIDAGRVRGPMQVQLRAWFDRSFSRVFGFFIRSMVIIAGCVTASIVCLGGVLWALLWLVVPLLPVLGIVLAIAGGTT